MSENLYRLDFSKITSLEDVIQVLQLLGLKFRCSPGPDGIKNAGWDQVVESGMLVPVDNTLQTSEGGLSETTNRMPEGGC